jgi:hypothetical protein
MAEFKRKVPLGKAIRWSQISGDVLLELATPNELDIAQARLAVHRDLLPFLEAELKDVESDLRDG